MEVSCLTAEFRALFERQRDLYRVVMNRVEHSRRAIGLPNEFYKELETNGRNYVGDLQQISVKLFNDDMLLREDGGFAIYENPREGVVESFMDPGDVRAKVDEPCEPIGVKEA